MARQIHGTAKRNQAGANGQGRRPTNQAEMRPTVEELMAMSETEIRGWMRHVGLRTLSELSADERRTD
jgi:hypothetical protein